MPLILLVPLLFAVLGAGISYVVARWQGLEGRAMVAAIAGGVIGGAVGGVLTVPAIGVGAVVTAATAATLPETAGLLGTATEFGALAVGQGVGSGVGQASSNAINGDPVMKDVGFATLIGGASQVVLTPVGDKFILALTPVVPTATRTIAVALARVRVSPSAVTGALGTVSSRWAGETTTEALTDGATMVVPPPAPEDAKDEATKPAAPQKGLTSAIDHAIGD